MRSFALWIRRERRRPRAGRIPCPDCRGRDRSPGVRAAPGLGAVRRPGRVHLPLGEPRSGRSQGPALAVFRHVPAADRPVRRNRGEVHRRCGHGGVGHACRPGGRRGAGRASCPRARTGRSGARRDGGLGPAQPADRRPDGGSGRQHRREGQGMVAGDLVNTASRVQAEAEPGTVLVGESTRRSTEAAIMYEPAGVHDLKGKAVPVPLWRALRVVAGVRGTMKSAGLEAPFVGRDRELRLVKEIFHGTVDNRKAHLLSVIGIAGIGKSRLGWEYFKYMDGLQQVVWWHRGRCLAYGEGVTYWALAEMVRGRADIVEGEDESSSLAKLRASVEQWIEDPEERAWVEPRLAHLLGLEERTAREPEDLFSAWRLFFERLADRNPTAMVFEDMQWADRGLLDFIDYLMNWSRNHPFFIMALARPEIAERHPDWAAGRRGSTTLHLEPLSDADMERLLTGLVPGLPERMTRQILERAEG